MKCSDCKSINFKKIHRTFETTIDIVCTHKKNRKLQDNGILSYANIRNFRYGGCKYYEQDNLDTIQNKIKNKPTITFIDKLIDLFDDV